MAEQRQDDHLEPKYNRPVPIQDEAWRTSRERWTIKKGGEEGSGISVLITRHHDDIYIYIFMSVCAYNVYIYIYCDGYRTGTYPHSYQNHIYISM